MLPDVKVDSHSWKMTTLLLCLLILKRKTNSIFRSDYRREMQKKIWLKKIEMFYLDILNFLPDLYFAASHFRFLVHKFSNSSVCGVQFNC